MLGNNFEKKKAENEQFASNQVMGVAKNTIEDPHTIFKVIRTLEILVRLSNNRPVPRSESVAKYAFMIVIQSHVCSQID